MWYAKVSFCQARRRQSADDHLTLGMWYAKNNQLKERQKLS